MVYLNQQGHDLEPLLEQIDTPKEFLEDPSYWLEAPKMEDFLTKADHFFSEGNKSIINVVGHSCPQLRSWGVLDSVLRMMEEPSDMYSQPQRFLSYFISPAPPIAELERKGNSISFSVPLAYSQYPMTFSYIKAALESLPAYVEATPATVSWVDNQIRISWNKDQGNLFPDEQMERNISPNFMHSLEMVIEKTQKEVEKKNKEILLRDKEIRELKEKLNIKCEEEVEDTHLNSSETIAQAIPGLVRLRGHIMKLADYLVRSQQVVTLLLSQNKGNGNLSKILSRLDWDLISREFPKCVQASSDEIQFIREIIDRLGSTDADAQINQDKESVDLNELVENALDNVVPHLSKDIRIERQLGLKQTVSAFPKALEDALRNIINCSAQALDGHGQIRVTTRPVGTHAKVEISEISEKPVRGAELVHSSEFGFKLREAKAIVRKHNGRLRVLTRPGQGAIFSIDLPIT